MAIILNELSLSGQFVDRSEFYANLSEFTFIIRSLGILKIPLLKCYDFYNRNVTPLITFHDCISDRAPEIVAYKIELAKLLTKPYWEDNPKHTCDDKYVCDFTQDECNYGLAEAVETMKIVVSFRNELFSSNKLDIAKNNEPTVLQNIYSKDSLEDVIIDLIRSKHLTYDDAGEGYLPVKKISDHLLPKQSLRDFTAGKNKGEQIAIYQELGKKVALINFWELDNIITSKNDRDIYKKHVEGRIFYLSIDTENGAFEIFNAGGNHVGEFNYKEEKTQPKPKSHTINL